ncbi:hypothetical protein D1614_19105 [Maribellus luteus]|uniref:Tyr recombinase domain-containing protein n=1 Tax=Maribellus luteus TaxID=2305463 RepID=A0A399SW34_9BACT|nr:tyrosine-type recombinase/integrase [Maribellus luteus]RIJ46315.1 hypothetical protein D1614_19105 [Maribellus luteus]
MKVNFNLKSPGLKESVIYIKFTYEKQQIRLSTGLKVHTEAWNKEIQRVRGRGEEARDLNDQLRLIDERVTGYLRQLFGSNIVPEEDIRLRVQNIISQAKGGFYLGKSLSAEELMRQISPQKLPPTINEAIQAYIDKKKSVFSDGRIRHYTSCKNILNDYHLGHLRIDQWDVSTFERLRDGMISKGRRNDTILIKVKMVKAVLRDLDPSHPALAFKFTTAPKHDQPILTEKELALLREAKIPADLEGTRDIFLFQCVTGQRISDINKLSLSSVSDGFWTIRQKKGYKLTKIPLNDDALSILSKYEYKLPTVSSQYHNRRLKELAKFAKLNRVALLQRKSGTKDIEIEKPMHEFISSHMARRIFITHSLNAGKPLHLIARITAQTIATLQKYEQAGEEALRSFW